MHAQELHGPVRANTNPPGRRKAFGGVKKMAKAGLVALDAHRRVGNASVIESETLPMLALTHLPRGNPIEFRARSDHERHSP